MPERPLPMGAARGVRADQIAQYHFITCADRHGKRPLVDVAGDYVVFDRVEGTTEEPHAGTTEPGWWDDCPGPRYLRRSCQSYCPGRSCR